jgi:hypothetical protein
MRNHRIDESHPSELPAEQRLMPYRLLCNDVQREGAKPRPDLASGLFYYVPLHNIWYGITASRTEAHSLVTECLLFGFLEEVYHAAFTIWL